MAKRNKGAPATQEQGKVNTSNEVHAPHPQVDVYYQTSDGLRFYLEPAAQNHADALKNKTIQKTINNK